MTLYILLNISNLFMLMLMLDLLPQAETPGVSHFGGYHRPPDGHFYLRWRRSSLGVTPKTPISDNNDTQNYSAKK